VRIARVPPKQRFEFGHPPDQLGELLGLRRQLLRLSGELRLSLGYGGLQGRGPPFHCLIRRHSRL
jgi:hypothetical protein